MNSPIFQSSLALFLNQFVQYKRALNRKYCADAEVLRQFDRYVQSSDISGLSAIDSSVIDDFLRSHPRRVSARSYDHLLGTVHRFFAFAVMQEWIDGTLLLPLLVLKRQLGFHICRSPHCKTTARRGTQFSGAVQGTISRTGLRDHLCAALRLGITSRRSSSADSGRCRC